MGEHGYYSELMGCLCEDVGYLYGRVLQGYTASSCDSFEVLKGEAHTLGAEEQEVLINLFEDKAAKLQELLCSYFYSDYPVICDIASDLVVRILSTFAQGVFRVYIVSGGYGSDDSAFHTWVYLEGKQSGGCCYIDLTYIQFLLSSRTEVELHCADGTTIMRLTYDGLRQRVFYNPEDVEFPPAVIFPEDEEWGSWFPKTVSLVADSGL